MATFERGGAEIHYDVRGDGYPVLLFAPGGMRSAASFWQRSSWNPIEVLAPRFRVIAMDQRNAGRSSAPVLAGDGWHEYTADHLALLDHLGIERCHLLGGCIGGSYCLGVIAKAPERVSAAVLQQPIGLSGENRQAFYDMFDGWANELLKSRPEIPDGTWREFRERMYGGDFVFNVSRDDVRACPSPLLVLMGNDLYHPEATSRDIVSLAPRAELVEQWKTPDTLAVAVDRVIAFLTEHTPT